MPDLAELNLVVKSSQLDQGKSKLDALAQSAAKAEKETEKLKQTNSSLEGTWGKILSLVAKVTAAYSAMHLVIQAIATAAEFEQMEIGFKTILKSGDKAKQMLADLQKFAIETPFEFKNLAEAAKLMLALGFEARDIVPNLRDIGDAVAAFGGGHDKMMSIVMDLGRMQASVRVTSREMLSLTQLGIPAWEILANVLGVTIPEAMERVEKGTVSGRMAVQGFLQEFRTKFGGSMDELSKTLGGIYSNLKDRLFFALKDVGEALVEAFDVKGKLQAVYDNTGRLSNILVDTIRILAGLQPKFHDTAETAEKLAKWISVIGLGVGAFLALESGIKLANAAMLIFNATTKVNPILFIISAAVAALYYFKDTMFEINGYNATLGEHVVNTWEEITKSIRHANDAMRDFLDLDKNKPGVLHPGDPGYNAQGLKYPVSWAMNLSLPAPAAAPTTQPVGTGPWGDPNWKSPITGLTIAEMEAKQRETSQKLKHEREMFTLDGGVKQHMEDEMMGQSIKQFKEMNQQLNLEIELLGKSSQERTIATAKLHLEKMQLQDMSIQQSEYLDKLRQLEEAKKLEEIAKGIGDAFGSTFEDMIMGAKSVGDAMRALAADIEKAVLRGVVTQPLAQGITSFISSFIAKPAYTTPSAAGGPVGSQYGVPGAVNGPTAVGSRLGNLFMNGSIVPFSMGGVFGGPTMFPMRHGWGMAGEDGEEGIFPLARDSRGRLGVRGNGGGGNITMHIHTNDADSFRRSKQQILNDTRQLFTRRG